MLTMVKNIITMMKKLKEIQYIVLIIALFLNFAVYHFYAQITLENRQHQFNSDAQQIVTLIINRMDAYTQVLLGGKALLQVKPEVNRQEWKAYVESQNLQKNFPGIQGVGLSVVVSPENRDAFVAKVQAEGFKNFTIHPEGERPLYTSILYLEPFDARNQRAFGYDMYSESIRHEAMGKAIETQKVELSGKVRLVQENSIDEQAGFLMYAPVYQKDMPLTTSSERYKALKAFVYAPFRVNDLLQGIAGAKVNSIKVVIYDKNMADDAMLYDSLPDINNSSGLEYGTKISIAGRDWVLRFHDIGNSKYSLAPIMMFLVGLILVLVLFIAINSISVSRKQLQKHAKELQKASMTDALTQLGNRKAFQERFDELIANYQRYKTVFSLLLLDIDYFKSINDNYGHLVGDDVLMALSKKMKMVARDTDCLYRFGGEEFVILLTQTNLENAVMFAERLREAVQRDINFIKGREITVSIGVAEMTVQDDHDSLLKRADDNLYFAKENGRNRVASRAS